MSLPALEDLQQDDLVLAVARALRVANHTAAAAGVPLEESLVTICEESPPPHRLWRVHYGPREYRPRRGGDFIVFVDEETASVRRTVRGQ